MDWHYIGNFILTFFMLVFLVGTICSVIEAVCTSDYKARMISWLEGRVRDLEWERGDLKADNTYLRAQIQWVRDDLVWAKRRAEIAEEQARSVMAGYDDMIAEMAGKKGGSNDGGAAARVAA